MMTLAYMSLAVTCIALMYAVFDAYVAVDDDLPDQEG